MVSRQVMFYTTTKAFFILKYIFFFWRKKKLHHFPLWLRSWHLMLLVHGKSYKKLISCKNNPRRGIGLTWSTPWCIEIISPLLWYKRLLLPDVCSALQTILNHTFNTLHPFPATSNLLLLEEKIQIADCTIKHITRHVSNSSWTTARSNMS
jgi:hypothetical protein